MKRKITHSIRFKITAMLILDVTAIIILLCFFNTLFFEKFYVKSKQKQLVSSYIRLGRVLEDYDNGNIEKEEFENYIERLCAPNNISAIILRSDWAAVYATANDTKLMKERMAQNLLGQQNKNNIILSTDEYTLQKVYDADMDGEYFEIFGYVGSDNSLLLRIPVKSITDSVQLSNKFILQVGVLFIVIASLSAWVLATRLAKPIKRLSAVAERMTEIKFDERYSGNDNDEIGILGESLNKLADKLDITISELKTANNELKNDIENKQKQEESRIDFIANVSHELKTPIALIQGYAEGLKEEIYDSKENAEYYCDVIVDEAKKMNDMVKQLLSLNQLESKNDHIVMEKFNVTELINSIAESNALRASQNGISIDVKINKPIIVWADEFKIEEVVTNYVTNAINHCEGEKIITIDSVEKGDVVRITVKNTGKNIPEEDIERIWEKFYKVDKARTRSYGGNGIGLSIVKAIMELHNKDYGVNNVEDGVEFWFELDTKVER